MKRDATSVGIGLNEEIVAYIDSVPQHAEPPREVWGIELGSWRDIALSLIGIPFGVLAVWAGYALMVMK